MWHTRRSMRLQGYDYAQAGAYSVIICTCERVCVFGEITDGEMRLNGWGRVVVDCWATIPAHFTGVEVDAFCVMPNHFHGIVIITTPSDHVNTVGAMHASPLPNDRPAGPRRRSLGAMVGSFKSAVTKRIREMTRAPDFVVWQRNYYEHVIRTESELNDVRRYVANNPLRWAEDENDPARPPARQACSA